MIGLYLSAHPLDDYKVIINHMCKTQLTELENLDPFKGQELSLIHISRAGGAGRGARVAP